MDAESTFQVYDWLWTSGQLSPRDIQKLPELGIETVINLALPTSSNAWPGEADMITELGIVYIQIPVEWERPELSQLHQFFEIMKVYEGKKLWVHCALNMRVSAFMYLYRRFCRGESEEIAVEPMRTVWQPNEIWQTFIDEAIEVYR